MFRRFKGYLKISMFGSKNNQMQSGFQTAAKTNNNNFKVRLSQVSKRLVFRSITHKIINIHMSLSCKCKNCCISCSIIHQQANTLKQKPINETKIPSACDKDCSCHITCNNTITY